MLRFLLLAVGLLAAFVWIEPDWVRSDRTLKLRVRESDEIVAYATARVRDLARRALEETNEVRAGLRSAPDGERDGGTPAVGAPAAADSGNRTSSTDFGIPPERLTRGERERLTRLVEEKLRQP